MKKLILTLMFGVLFLSIACVSAESLVVGGENGGNLKDAYCDSKYPTKNMDGYFNSLLSTCNGRNIYVSFDLQNLLKGDVYEITSANLRFRGSSVNPYTTSNNFTSSIYYLYGDWVSSTDTNILGEKQLTWNNQPCGTNFNNSTNCNLNPIEANVKIADKMVYNVKEGIEYAVENENEQISFAIKSTSKGLPYSCTNTRADWQSKETGKVTYPKPTLEITYEPYISVIYPIESQMFNEDEVFFLIKTATSMDDCEWSLDEGVTTTNMIKLGNYYLSMPLISVGSHDVRFYCNEGENTFKSKLTNFVVE